MKSYIKFSEQVVDGAIEEMVVVLDNSPSMAENDIIPSRLEAASLASCAWIDTKADAHPGDRVGVVCFAGSARVLHRMVTVGSGRVSLQEALKNLSTSSCTNISAGLERAAEMLGVRHQAATVLGSIRRLLAYLANTSSSSTALSATTRRILLLSDGAANVGEPPVAVADRLKRQGIVIDVIGVGTDGGADDFDEPTLKRIASRNSDGSERYCFINDASALVRKFETLAHHIRPMEA